MQRASTSPAEGVNYVATGDGGPPIVLLHGFSDNLHTWDRLVPRLAVDHRVLAIDLPGFGCSTRPWTSPLLDCYLAAVRAVLDAEGVTDPVTLMGNSMGGVVATLFAARHPERTDRVVLIDMPGLRHVPRLWRLAMSRPAELGVDALLHLVPAWAARSGLGWAYGRIAAADPRHLDPLVRRGYTTPYAARDKLVALLPLGRALLGELRTAELATLVAALDVPALLVFGSRDLLTPARVLRRIGRPGGAVVLPSCGHCPQIDRPAELLAEVIPFLRAETGDAEAARTA
jgi:pimeloyl-ACP methyl ester carboxylesterase